MEERFPYRRKFGATYSFEALQRPTQPSERRNDPAPCRPENRPVLTMVMPFTLPTARTAPSGLTVPRLDRPISLPLVTTATELLLPKQDVPTPTTTQAPSKLPAELAPPLDRALGGSIADLPGSSDGDSGLEPESDFSSLPMLPPALPDWASTKPGFIIVTTARTSASLNDFFARSIKVICFRLPVP
jgi:hypothetical protein